MQELLREPSEEREGVYPRTGPSKCKEYEALKIHSLLPHPSLPSSHFSIFMSEEMQPPMQHQFTQSTLINNYAALKYMYAQIHLSQSTNFYDRQNTFLL